MDRSGLKDALAANLKTALPDDYTVEVGYRNPADIDAGARPHCCVFGSTTATEQEEFQQGRTTITLTVHLVRRPDEESEMDLDIEAAEAALRDSPRLFGAIYDSYYSATAVDPTGQAATVGLLTYAGEYLKD